jgi:hypothetical protein
MKANNEQNQNKKPTGKSPFFRRLRWVLLFLALVAGTAEVSPKVVTLSRLTP